MLSSAQVRGKPRASVDANSDPPPSISRPTGINRSTPTRPAEEQLTNERHHKRAKLESFPLPQDHPAVSTHSSQRKLSNPQAAREDHKSNKAELTKSDVTKESIPPPPQKYHSNLTPSVPRSHDYSYHRSSYTGSSSHHSSRGTPGSPASYRAPLNAASAGSRTNLPAGPRSWSSQKIPVAAGVPGNGPPSNSSAQRAYQALSC
ncbi:hypothetical protein PGT21_033500 [Puccinia graminis f. sp. tritici]|uniref:Uncharacterized protein n=1 Tax=Puccinia graminis f. sp. tritici TaxID=56615 RepID=A0A5B0MWD1_PUCGR|nr:hypothetical protein PGT21_033500 [Puccinia graminis f. sp. tritici]